MKSKIIGYVIAMVVGAGACMYFDKDIHEIEEKIVYRDRVRTVVKEVITEKPDGTRIIERETNKDEVKDSVSTKKESIPTKKNWAVGVKYDLFSHEPVWTAEVQRRVIGDIYAGAYGRTDGIVGVGITILF